MTLRYTVSGDVPSPDGTPEHAVIHQRAVRTRAGRLATPARYRRPFVGAYPFPAARFRRPASVGPLPRDPFPAGQVMASSMPSPCSAAAR